MNESPRRFERIAFVASQTSEAEAARARLIQRYGAVDVEDADVIVALGGDGLMLQSLHRFRDRSLPIYGMHRGSVGFLMNTFREADLHERLAQASHVVIHPLLMETVDAAGERRTALAINEVSLLRQTYQAAKLRISIDGKVRLEELICDGVLVATPAGSTAYNLSAHGPILPLGTALLALTPISPFRPRRWRGALIPDRATIQITVLEADKRPVSAVADHQEVRDIVEVTARLDQSSSMDMLFDPDHGLDERILREQFIY
ncbi:NAD kinase [Azorhizobium oxalatiphilum]|uniref:NAD kinase n=1 Tax=Azorhizobium oxalatiphilum TaxID=980631 RepID=A0A917FHH1_9HYPH|nr:NAD kinase [Azorhizobium oxalatiphilum]GGF85241.1 NAD kinase [Azorhizobium oxalatiphilum]